MSYVMRIHHLDFGKDPGDATLVALWTGADESSLGLEQILLIDGGSSTAGFPVIRQALERYNLLEDGTCSVPVTIVVTNFVPNFYGGLSMLIISGILGSNVNIYDLGQYGQATSAYDAKNYSTWITSFFQEPSQYATYKQNMGIFLATEQSDQDLETPPANWATSQVAYLTSSNSLNWTPPATFLQVNPQVKLNTNAGLTVTMLCMNTMMGGGQPGQMNTNGGNPLQDRSMGLCLEFGDGGNVFRYYHGGALTTTQEGGTPNTTAVADPNQQTNLSVQLNSRGPVHVAKLAGKGAITGTGVGFLKGIGAGVAIVTCGTDGITAMSESAPFNTPNLPSLSLPLSLPVNTVAYLTGETLPSGTLNFTALDTFNPANGRIVIAGSWPPGDIQPMAVGDITVEVWQPTSAQFDFTVSYLAPVDAWINAGGAKNDTTPIRFVDTYQVGGAS